MQPTMQMSHFFRINSLPFSFFDDVRDLPHAVHPVVEQTESRVLLEIRNRVFHQESALVVSILSLSVSSWVSKRVVIL